ncbi:MAG: SOS response-associated peptidase [Bacteroidales bacterium]|jgi:putative SOS response-associated peptidase YedK
MCFYSKLSQDALAIAKRFKATYPSAGNYVPKDIINAYSYPSTPVVTDMAPSVIQDFNWGLVPDWHLAPENSGGIADKYRIADLSIRKYTLNARIETVRSTKSFKDSVNNRCLVIADGFYEWQHLFEKDESSISSTRNGKIQKKKFLITLPDEEIFSFAGLYSSWTNPITGEIYNTYTVLTTEANELMSQIHNSKKRMPVILRAEDENRWLEHCDIEEFAYPYSVQLLATAQNTL